MLFQLLLTIISVHHRCVKIVILALFYVENIALNKPTWQSNQYNQGDDRFDVSNAVDGLKSNLSWSGGQCAVSRDKQQTATWKVDLGDILSIRHITIYYRTDNVAFGLYSLQVLYSA
jgi:hypothetical protein